MDFEVGTKLYYAHLSPWTLGSLSESTIEEVLSDGRAISPWLEVLVASQFPNLQHDTTNQSWDFLDSANDNAKVSLRGLAQKSASKKGSVDLVRGKMLGIGRAYDEDEHAQHLVKMNGGYIIALTPRGYRHLMLVGIPSECLVNGSGRPMKKISQKFISDRIGQDLNVVLDHLISKHSSALDQMVSFELPFAVETHLLKCG